MITLRFSASDKIGARLIRWFTWSDFSHVDFHLRDGASLGTHLLGAKMHGGVQIRSCVDDEPGLRYLWATVDAPQSVIDCAMAQLGKPYDWTGIIGVAIRRPLQSRRRWFCSELVAWAFEQAGYPLLNSTDKARITPRDLLMSPLLKVAN